MARKLYEAFVGMAGFEQPVMRISSPEVEGMSVADWAGGQRLNPGTHIMRFAEREMTAEEERRWQLYWPKKPVD